MVRRRELERSEIDTVKGLKYTVEDHGNFAGIKRDWYPTLTTTDVKGVLIPAPMRDPMDTPRQIGFRAKHGL